MTCDEVRESLSAYLDGELEDSLTEHIGAHLETCGDCVEDLEELSRLSRLLAPARRCTTPEGLWARIAAHVSATSAQPGRRPSTATVEASRLAGRWRWVAAAASVGLATFVSSYWVASRTWFMQPVQTAYGLALGVYVEELEEGTQVFERFRAMHERREVSPDEMVRQVGFTPLVPDELPDGFRLDKSYVLATTCCNAIEIRYIKGSQLVTVFQQGRGHPVSFPGLEAEPARIDGVVCRRVRVGDIVVVNWDGDGRNMTLLARADVPQIEAMVQFLNTTP